MDNECKVLAKKTKDKICGNGYEELMEREIMIGLNEFINIL